MTFHYHPKTNTFTEDVSKWKTDEVKKWLKSLDIDEYTKSFVDKKIQGQDLLSLDNEQDVIQKLGVSKLGHRRRIWNEIQSIKKNNNCM